MESWSVSGTYLEACNCEAICPCRRIDGVSGGRSTTGLCRGALSWLIEEGRAGDVDLAGLGVVLAGGYSDDEEGSPWDFVLFVDERADEHQRAALIDIFMGRLGGTALDHFPWAWKDSRPLEPRPARIEIDHTAGRGWFRVGEQVHVRVRAPYEGDSTVSCVIPGHEREGREVYAERLVVAEGPLEYEFEGKCGYESTFSYASHP
jgi:hypothetical protein